MTSAYSSQERQLKNIIKKHLKSEKRIKLCIFYKNLKLKNLLIRNQPVRQNSPSEQSSLVYQFTCPEDGCSTINSHYIGYTTCTLKKRMTEHFYSGAIRSHGQDEHNKRFSKEEILNNATVMKKDSSPLNLRILEALLIKKHRPSINRKDEGFTRTLGIF